MTQFLKQFKGNNNSLRSDWNNSDKMHQCVTVIPIYSKFCRILYICYLVTADLAIF